MDTMATMSRTVAKTMKVFEAISVSKTEKQHLANQKLYLTGISLKNYDEFCNCLKVVDITIIFKTVEDKFFILCTKKRIYYEEFVILLLPQLCLVIYDNNKI